jgi:RimJ/RimL family protein N-acetyltransferase
MKLSEVRLNDMNDGSALSHSAGSAYNPLLDRCIARITPEGKLVGGAVFRNYTGIDGSIVMHVHSWSPRWLTRTLVFMAFDYMFNQLQVKKVFGNIPMKNAQALKFARDAGFNVETIIPDVFPGDDMAVMSLYRDECRFLALAARRTGNGT